jgi:hypothetical protein
MFEILGVVSASYSTPILILAIGVIGVTGGSEHKLDEGISSS